jgi:REP element-mobilizing transposase RayT
MPQSLSRIVVHLVFSTYQRTPNLTDPIQERLFPYFGGILHGIKCQPIQMGGHNDHVHLLFGLSRTLSIAEVVEKVKVASSKWIKDEFPQRKNFAWQSGYGVLSVDSSDCQGAVAYIFGQKEHHKKVSFMDECRDIMRLSGVEYDERYMWD